MDYYCYCFILYTFKIKLRKLKILKMHFENLFIYLPAKIYGSSKKNSIKCLK